MIFFIHRSLEKRKLSSTSTPVGSPLKKSLQINGVVWQEFVDPSPSGYVFKEQPLTPAQKAAVVSEMAAHRLSKLLASNWNVVHDSLKTAIYNIIQGDKGKMGNQR